MILIKVPLQKAETKGLSIKKNKYLKQGTIVIICNRFCIFRLVNYAKQCHIDSITTNGIFFEKER